MIWLISFFTLIGINFSVWALIGLIRFCNEKKLPARYHYVLPQPRLHSFLQGLELFAEISGLKIIFKLIAFLPRMITKGLGQTIEATQKVASLSRQKISQSIFYIRDSFRDPDYSPDFSQKLGKETLARNSASPSQTRAAAKVNLGEVAAIIPAHNEEATIGKTLRSLKKIMPAKNIYVGSDASTDRTVEIVNDYGCQVFDINPNLGKANVLTFLLAHYDLISKYKAVIIVDADSEVDENYLKNTLPFFEDPSVAAVAAHAMSKWSDHWPPRLDMLYTAYRVRLYRVLQAVFRYGQTWKYTNVSMIIPGFASIYRTSVLAQININAPGLVIEDYNMTFELHSKKLGIIGYSPQAKGYSQDPLNLKDYFKQLKRWNLGLWQTIKKHSYRTSLFWLSLIFYILEIMFYGAFLLTVPLLFLWFFMNSFEPLLLPFTLPWLDFDRLSFIDILVGIFLFDYLITVIVSIFEKKPLLLVYGFAFVFLRYIDALVLFYTLPLAFTVKSDGRWVSPKRKATVS